MSDPSYAPPLAGDSHDDDGQVLESLFEQQPNALDPTETNAVVVTHADKQPVRPSRQIAGYLTIDFNTVGVPLLILPTDVDRTSLQVKITGTVATDYVQLADEPNKLAYVGTSGQSARHYVGSGPTDMGSHTGSLWVQGVGVTGVVLITWWSVTK